MVTFPLSKANLSKYKWHFHLNDYLDMVFTFERKLCCKQLKLYIFFSFLFYKEVTRPHLLKEVVTVAILPRVLLFSLIYLFDCVGLSCGIRASLVTALRLSCPMACAILVPWTGIKPLPPALEGGFLTTRPPVKSQVTCFITEERDFIKEKEFFAKLDSPLFTFVMWDLLRINKRSERIM